MKRYLILFYFVIFSSLLYGRGGQTLIHARRASGAMTRQQIVDSLNLDTLYLSNLGLQDSLISFRKAVVVDSVTSRGGIVDVVVPMQHHTTKLIPDIFIPDAVGTLEYDSVNSLIGDIAETTLDTTSYITLSGGNGVLIFGFSNSLLNKESYALTDSFTVFITTKSSDGLPSSLVVVDSNQADAVSSFGYIALIDASIFTPNFATYSYKYPMSVMGQNLDSVFVGLSYNDDPFVWEIAQLYIELPTPTIKHNLPITFTDTATVDFGQVLANSTVFATVTLNGINYATDVVVGCNPIYDGDWIYSIEEVANGKLVLGHPIIGDEGKIYLRLMNTAGDATGDPHPVVFRFVVQRFVK